jgi:hypothetical protein
LKNHNQLYQLESIGLSPLENISDIGVEAWAKMDIDKICLQLGHQVPELLPPGSPAPDAENVPPHWLKYKLIPSFPFFTEKVHLRRSQRVGVASCTFRSFHNKPNKWGGAWINDAVGLGKTAQSIGVICQIRHLRETILEGKALPPIIGASMFSESFDGSLPSYSKQNLLLSAAAS